MAKLLMIPHTSPVGSSELLAVFQLDLEDALIYRICEAAGMYHMQRTNY